MLLSERENTIRNATFRGHEWIPQCVALNGAYWGEHREALEEVCLRHPTLFPGFRKGQVNFDAHIRRPEQKRVTDTWGCLWAYDIDGFDGQVIGHPLEDWSAMASGAWRPPTPPEFTQADRDALAAQRAEGTLTQAWTDHGFLFMRLFYLRGFENFLMDVATEDPRLDALIETVIGYWERTLLPRIEAGVDIVNAADDLGTQTASILGPKYFQRYLLPAYQRIFQAARRKGSLVKMHHDGYILDIMDDLIASGVNIVNPQDLVNGIDALAAGVKGRACICLDVDRQSVLPFGSPGDVRDLIGEEVMKLGSPAGGLEMIVGVYPPTPLANVEALMSAMEEYRTYWVGK